MNYEIQHNSLTSYYDQNKNKYSSYNFTGFLNQDKFDVIFSKILAEKHLHNIFIFLDHDSDGINSGLIMQEIFTNLGIPHYLYIHSRHNIYGINEDVIIEHFMKTPYTVFISADLGITNKAEIEFLRYNFNPIIILLDHHGIQPDKYPIDADCVINPKLSIEKTGEYVCGAGLVYTIFKKYYLNQAMKIFAMIGTLGDIVPINPSSLNRNICIEGLQIINSEKIENNQLRFMFEQIYGWGSKTITEMDISFSIVPMINSLSRYYIENTVKDYFSCEKGYNRIYGIMKETNDKRKEDQKTIEKLAMDKVYDSDINIIVVNTPHKSLLGIVSSCILNKKGKPNFVLSENESGFSGSGRSNDSFNLFELIMSLPQEWLVNAGGHAKAAGIAIKKDYMPKFTEYINKIKLPKLSPPQIIQLSNFDFDNNLIPILKEFSPFGEENKAPLFLLQNMEVEKIRFIREHSFITCSFSSEDSFESNYIEVCYFNFDIKLKKKDKINIVGTFSINKEFFVEQLELIK